MLMNYTNTYTTYTHTHIYPYAHTHIYVYTHTPIRTYAPTHPGRGSRGYTRPSCIQTPAPDHGGHQVPHAPILGCGAPDRPLQGGWTIYIYTYIHDGPCIRIHHISIYRQTAVLLIYIYIRSETVLSPRLFNSEGLSVTVDTTRIYI